MIEKSQILSALSGLELSLELSGLDPRLGKLLLYEINADGNYVSIIFGRSARTLMTLIPHSDKNLIDIKVLTSHLTQDFGQSSLEDLPLAVVSLTPKHYFFKNLKKNHND